LLCAKLTIQEQVGYGGDFVYDKAVGDEIKWKEGKNLTVQTEIKKQRNKSESPFSFPLFVRDGR
jgi:hypothetical protein